MKRVAIISAMNFNNNSAGSKRVDSYSRTLSSKVESVFLISVKSKTIDHVFTFERIKNNIYSGIESNSNRSIKTLVIFLRSFQHFIKENSKVKIILYPSSFFIFDFIIVLFLLTRGIPFYVELNEVRKFNSYIIKDDLFSSENLKHNFKYIFGFPIHMVMDLLFKKAAGHIYISTKISEYYGGKNFIIIPILCNDKNLSNTSFKKYDKSEVFNIGFAGSIDPDKEKMTTFFSAIRTISKTIPNIRINLYGYIYKKEFFNLLAKHDIKDYFVYKGLIDKNELIRKLKEDNHLLILPRGYTKQNYYGFSTKLSGYLNSQIPILTSTVGDIGKYFINMKNSFTYKPDNIDSLTKKLEFIIMNYNAVAPDIILGGDKLVNDVFHYSNYSNLFYNFLFDNNK